MRIKQYFPIMYLMLLFVSVSFARSGDAWANASLPYRREINITHASGLTDYQVALNITYVSTMKSNFDDIRFYTSNGTKLNYWVETKVDSSWAYVWVRVPKINSTSYIYAYWGNSTATSESNADSTFLFYDDFSGASLNTSKWSAEQGTWTISSSQLQASQTSGRYDRIRLLGVNASENISFVYMQRYGSGGYYETGSAFGVDVYNSYLFVLNNDMSSRVNKIVGGSVIDNWIAANNAGLPAKENFVKVQYTRLGNNYLIYINNILKLNFTNSEINPTNVYFMDWSLTGSEIDFYDNVSVRRAAYVEPSSAFGTIENSFGVSISNPIQNSYFNSTTQNITFYLNYNVNSSAQCLLYDNGQLKTSMNGPFTAFQNYTFANQTFTDGARTLSVNCSNASFNASVNIIVDTTPPSISITHPYNNQFMNTTSINILATIADANLNYTNISIWQGTTLINSTTTTNTTWSVQYNVSSDGVYQIKATAYDKAGNINLATVNITADGTNPTLSVNYSISEWDTVDYVTTIYLNVSAADTNYNSTTVNLKYYNGTLISSQTYTNASFSSNVIAPSTTNRYYIEVIARDRAGNSNTSTRYFKTFDYSIYNAGLDIDSKSVSNQNCYETFTLNNKTYYVPIISQNGTFLNSNCRTAFTGVIYNGSRISSATQIQGTNTPCPEDHYNGLSWTIVYDFNTSRNATILGSDLNITNSKNQTLTISTYRSSSSTSYYFYQCYFGILMFLKNGSVCVNNLGYVSGSSFPGCPPWSPMSPTTNTTTCIDGFNETLVLTTYGTGAWSGSVANCEPLTYDTWLFNSSVINLLMNRFQVYVNTNSTTNTMLNSNVPSFFALMSTNDQFFKNASPVKFVLTSKNNAPFFTYYFTNEYYAANIISTSSQIIKPKWISYLGANIGNAKLTLYNAYNLTDYTVNLLLNNGTVVQDETTNNCYFVPAYTPTNLSIIQTMVGYVILCESTITTTLDLPLVPQYVNCRKVNNTYYINSTSQFDILHKVYYTATDNTTYYDGELGKNFSRNYSLSSYPIINYTVGTTTYCFHDETRTSILGLQKMNISSELKSMVVTPLMIFSFGLSIFNPFVFVFSVALNDSFDVFAVDHLFAIAVLLSISSFFFAHNTNKTLKNGFIYIGIFVAYITLISNYAPTATTSFSEDLNSIRGNMTAMTEQMQPNETNLLAMISNSVNIVLTLAKFIVMFPMQMINLIFSTITLAVPLLSTPLSVFATMLTLAVYMWIIVKIYEILRNTFRDI